MPASSVRLSLMMVDFQSRYGLEISHLKIKTWFFAQNLVTDLGELADFKNSDFS
jgi:hypothetical protein